MDGICAEPPKYIVTTIFKDGIDRRQSKAARSGLGRNLRNVLDSTIGKSATIGDLRLVLSKQADVFLTEHSSHANAVLSVNISNVGQVWPPQPVSHPNPEPCIWSYSDVGQVWPPTVSYLSSDPRIP